MLDSKVSQKTMIVRGYKKGYSLEDIKVTVERVLNTQVNLSYIKQVIR